jgi:heat shock protein HslJ
MIFVIVLSVNWPLLATLTIEMARLDAGKRSCRDLEWSSQPLPHRRQPARVVLSGLADFLPGSGAERPGQRKPTGWNRTMHSLLKPGGSLLAVLILVSCSKPAGEAVKSEAGLAPDAGQVSVASVEPTQAYDVTTGSFTGFEGIAELVQLQQGKWEGSPWVEGAAARPQIILLDGMEATGDLDEDGIPESVVLLNLAMGGTGQLLYLATIPRDADSNSAIPVTEVGDRVKIRAIDISGGRLSLDVLQAGPEDAMCCAGELATRTWEMNERGELLEVDSGIAPSRFTVATLAGSEWELERWSAGELAENTGISLAFDESGIAGSSGCNRYNASLSDGESPGAVSVGPVAGTRMACPEQQMTFESRYLQALAATSKLTFLNGRLLLTAASEAGITSLYFVRKVME